MDRIIKKSGFTLAELLIVVAIIGVLVAVSVPIFTNQLKRARFATNQANAKAAYAAAMAWYLDNCNTDLMQIYKDTGIYDVKTGKFTPGDNDSDGRDLIDTNITNWNYNSPYKGYSPKKWVTDKVFTKWDVYWNEPFDGTIAGFIPHD
ncbi:MAG: prepilin-type N-terminal cleavage/methylation domain-containing protein [Oribacterium sp.]|nr:prepilin-type N-terminal cleavage/methylation domain-containing protein [Oribacterium sp.]